MRVQLFMQFFEQVFCYTSMLLFSNYFFVTVCQCNKNCTEHPAGKLMPNLISEKPWAHISADFITKLPLVQEYDSILVVVDRLTKIVYFISTIEKTSAKGLARLFRDNVWKLHRLSKSSISDRGPQFIVGIMQELNKMLGIESKLSTVFHLQTDRQIERVNQELEQYLRMFIDHRQKQWPDWLEMAKFAYNNKVHLSTKILPFKVNYRQNSRMGFEIRKKEKVQRGKEIHNKDKGDLGKGKSSTRKSTRRNKEIHRQKENRS